MASLNLNHVILAGRLTRDPELKVTPSGVQLCSFSVAVNKRKKQNEPQSANFFECTSAGKTAELVTKFFRKGSSILVIGELDIDEWTDQSGAKRQKPRVFANDIRFVDSLQSDGAANGINSQPMQNMPPQNAQNAQTPQNTQQYSAPQYQPQYAPSQTPSYPPLADMGDGELPF